MILYPQNKEIELKEEKALELKRDMQGGITVRRKAHNLEIGGSIPPAVRKNFIDIV